MCLPRKPTIAKSVPQRTPRQNRRTHSLEKGEEEIKVIYNDTMHRLSIHLGSWYSFIML